MIHLDIARIRTSASNEVPRTRIRIVDTGTAAETGTAGSSNAAFHAVRVVWAVARYAEAGCGATCCLLTGSCAILLHILDNVLL